MYNYNTIFLREIGIDLWELKSKQVSEPKLDPFDDLRHAIAKCTACGLHKGRTQTVFGVGDHQAQLMLIGEAPGFYEDQQGEPFVGRAGQLLDSMLQAIGLDRQQVFICNILKCRPPNNRDPSLEEVALCTPFLEKQISLVKPRLILALGRIAAHYLLKTTAPLNQMRNKMHSFGSNAIPLLVTYHPAYLLRNPKDKKKAYEDLRVVLNKI